jgi:hypothetical protein
MRTFLRCFVVCVSMASVASVEAGETSIPKKLTPDTFEAIKSRVSLAPEDLAARRLA